MPKLRWTGRGQFSTSQGLIESGESAEFDEEEADELLNHRTGEWEEVEPTAIDALDKPDEDANSEGVTESPSDPEEDPEASNPPESESEHQTYPREDLESKEYDELQKLAMESDNDDINGRSSGDEIIEALAEN